MQPETEDLCRSYEEAGEKVIYTSSSNATVLPETPVL